MAYTFGELSKYIKGVDRKKKEWIIDDDIPEEDRKELMNIINDIKKARTNGVLV